MPPNIITSLNIFTEKNNKPPIKGCTDDQLAMVKAAAWAWLEHGSGSEGKPMCEFDAKRTLQVVARPSRYRLEAMRMMEDSMEGSKTPSSVYTDKSLLDTYEIESISRQLDYLMRSTNLDVGAHAKRKSEKFLGRFRLMRHRVLCGTRQDVDTTALVSSGRRRQQQQRESHVRVVKMPNGRY